MARNESDAAALKAKVAAKKAREELAGDDIAPSKAPIPRKKVDTKKEAGDDLLLAGLSATKKSTRAK
jgi:hypothetical protein